MMKYIVDLHQRNCFPKCVCLLNPFNIFQSPNASLELVGKPLITQPNLLQQIGSFVSLNLLENLNLCQLHLHLSDCGLLDELKIGIFQISYFECALTLLQPHPQIGNYNNLSLKPTTAQAVLRINKLIIAFNALYSQEKGDLL